MIEPKVGQLWVPKKKAWCNVRAKRITMVGPQGTVYAKSEPPVFERTLPNHYTKARWSAWVASNQAEVKEE